MLSGCDVNIINQAGMTAVHKAATLGCSPEVSTGLVEDVVR